VSRLKNRPHGQLLFGGKIFGGKEKREAGNRLFELRDPVSEQIETKNLIGTSINERTAQI
jgi:hypothetical protein